MQANRSSTRLGLGAFAVVVACSAPADLQEPSGMGTEAIVNGVLASDYPEAALVDMYQGGQLGAYCSGSVIAPRVVLTAGHCVTGDVSFQPDSWRVTTPYNGKQKAKASDAVTYDWTVNFGTVSPTLHDVGLIFLDTPIVISPSQCPAVAQTELPDQSQIVNIGRIKSGSLSKTDLFVSKGISVVDGASQGYPFDYSAADVIESGDSGGPDEVLNASPHLIVAVNSGGGSGEVLARTDPMVIYDWIQKQIASHGGGCGGTGTDAGTGGSADASPHDAAPAGVPPEAAPPEAGGSPPASVDAMTADVATVEASASTMADTDAAPADTDGAASDEGGPGSNTDNPGSTTFTTSRAGSCSCRVSGRDDSAPGPTILGCVALTVVALGRRRRRRVGDSPNRAPLGEQGEQGIGERSPD